MEKHTPEWSRPWLWRDSRFTAMQSRTLREQQNKLANSHAELLAALENIVWKLGHNETIDGDGTPTRPCRIDRGDVVIWHAVAAIAKATGQGEG